MIRTENDLRERLVLVARWKRTVDRLFEDLESLRIEQRLDLYTDPDSVLVAGRTIHSYLSDLEQELLKKNNIYKK